VESSEVRNELGKGSYAHGGWGGNRAIGSRVHFKLQPGQIVSQKKKIGSFVLETLKWKAKKTTKKKVGARSMEGRREEGKGSPWKASFAGL